VNARDALKAKKHVLCEKPVTSNAAEVRTLTEIARENNVFFMEAMWTRFQPLTQEVKKIAEDGQLGDIVAVHADLSGDFDIQNIPKTHRILDPKLGGGALLDLGPYPLIWALLFLYENPTNNKLKPTNISASMIKTPLTGVDTSTAFTVAFGSGHLSAHAILSCNITIPASPLGVLARFRNGNIKIDAPIFSPRSFTVQYFDKPGSGKIVREETKTFSYVGNGWHFQADEVARCARAGKIESDLWPHAVSIVQMEIFDEVRRQGGYVLPEGVEQVV
jgi:predicted dehydrogenase